MKRKHKLNHVISFYCALISFIFMLISGTTGVRGWIQLGEIVLRYANFPLINLLFLLIIIIASFGGLTVLIGGYLILKKKVVLGDLLISIGMGAGFFGLLVSVLISFMTLEFSIAPLLSFSSLGLIFAMLARLFSVSMKKRFWYKFLIKIFKK